MKLIPENINESIKHLKPRSEEEINNNLLSDLKETVYSKILNLLKKNRIKISRNEMNKVGQMFLQFFINRKYVLFITPMYAITTIYRLYYDKGNSIIEKIFWTDNGKDMYETIKNLITGNLTESIKHLKPRSEEELQAIYKSLSPTEKLQQGVNQKLPQLIEDALKEGVDIISVIKATWRNENLNDFYEKLINNKKEEIREALKGKPALDRLHFTDRYDIKWLYDEIKEKEGDLIAQEELAQEFYGYDDNPIYTLKQIKKVFDPLREYAFKANYKILSEKEYLVTLSQNIYLTDEVEDIVIEDEEPVIFTIKITIDINKLIANYDFGAKYKDNSDIGYDEGSFKIDKKTMGDDYEDYFEYILGDVQDEYDKFKEDMLIIVEKMHTESEQFDEEKYYPQLQESIKHLKPRSEEELRSSFKNLSPEEKLETGAKEGLLWLVKDALDAGADVHAYDDYALRWASRKGHLEVVKVLLDAGADVHAENDWALRWASYKGHVEVVKVLLDAGADVHASNDHALQCASGRGHIEVVKLLKQYSKKKVNESIKHLKPRSQEELEIYYKKLKPNEKLIMGCVNNNFDLVKKAIKERADIHMQNDRAFRIVCGRGFIEIVKLLFNEKPNIHAQEDWALRHASENGYTEVVKLLLEAGADVNAWDNYALRYASYYGHVEVVKLLLDTGKNISIDGALRLARDPEIIELLKQYIETDIGHKRILRLKKE